MFKGGVLIGIFGRTASGKSTFAKRLKEAFNNEAYVNSISMDNFYSQLTDSEHHLAVANNYNFDTPDAFDLGNKKIQK